MRPGSWVSGGLNSRNSETLQALNSRDRDGSPAGATSGGSTGGNVSNHARDTAQAKASTSQSVRPLRIME